MIKFYTIAALLVLSTNNTLAATVQPSFDPLVVEHTIPEWSVVGHDTCKVNPGCTPSWAMESFEAVGVLPFAIAMQARMDFRVAEMELAAGETPTWQTYYVCHGDVVASSFSNREGKLTTVREIKATFADCTPGLGWTYVDYETGKTYEVFRVIECGNYTIREVTPAVAGYVSTPLYAAFVPHRSYGAGHRFGDAGFGGTSGGTSSDGDSFTSYITQVTNITNVVNEFCDICCDPEVPDPDPETPAPVPLPASGILMLAGLGGLAYLRRRKTS
jgi:PEP-CTERM motif